MGVLRVLLGAYLAGTTVHLFAESPMAYSKAYSRAPTDVNNQIKFKLESNYIPLEHKLTLPLR